MAGYIGRIPVPQAVLHAEAYIATAGQTTFSTSNGYVPGYIMVYKNGVLLPASDYTATDGSVVELDAGVACNAGDTVDIWIFGTFEAAFFTSLASDIDANSYNITNIGKIEFSDGTNLIPSITNTGDTDTGFYFPTADKIGSTTGGNVALSIFNNGSAGIYEFGGTTGYLRHTGSSTLYLDASSTGTGGNIIVRAGSSYTERLRIDTQGDLLLGTTTSRARLTVYDTDATVASIWSNQTGALIQYVDVSGGINVKAGGQGNDFIIQTGGATRATVSNAGEFGIGGTPISGYKLTVADFSDAKAILSSTSGNTELYFDNSGANLQWIKSDRTASDLRFGIANVERMRIDSSGNLIVGGTSASGILSVHAGGSQPVLSLNNTANDPYITFEESSTPNFYIGASEAVGGSSGYYDYYGIAGIGQRWFTNAAEAMRLTSGGNLGLGITNPVYKLGVSNSGAEGIEFGPAYTSGANLIQHYNRSGSAYVRADTIASAHRWRINGTEIMTLDTNGRLGIGTMTPDTILHLLGSGASLKVQESGGADMRVVAGGSIGYVGTYSNHPVNVLVNGATVAEFDSNGWLELVSASQGRITLGNAGTPGNNTSNWIRGSGNNVTTNTATGYHSWEISGSERARISALGGFKATSNGSYNSSTSSQHELYQHNNTVGLLMSCTNASYADHFIQMRASRGNTSAFSFLEAFTSGTGDKEFHLTGAGTGLCDGSWTGGGADYAEWFEWADGNPNDEDRAGLSVVLENGKVRPAQEGEIPFGAVSTKPGVVGDGDIGRWKKKYLKDDFDRYIMEECTYVEWYEIDDNSERKHHVYQSDRVPNDLTVPDDAIYSDIDDSGEPHMRRKLNPDYDPNVEYIPRENRPEWVTIGLMGKLRIYKDQPKAPTWMKMKDISDRVEEWFVR